MEAKNTELNPWKQGFYYANYELLFIVKFFSINTFTKTNTFCYNGNSFRNFGGT